MALAQIRPRVHIPILKNGVIYGISITLQTCLPGGLVVRIPRFHRGGRGSIPRLGSNFDEIVQSHESLSGREFRPQVAELSSHSTSILYAKFVP